MNVKGRMGFASPKGEKVPGIEELVKEERKGLNAVIKAKTGYEQAKKRIVSTCRKFVTAAFIMGVGLSVSVNGRVLDYSMNPDDARASFANLLGALYAQLDNNPDEDLNIRGNLIAFSAASA